MCRAALHMTFKVARGMIDSKLPCLKPQPTRVRLTMAYLRIGGHARSGRKGKLQLSQLLSRAEQQLQQARQAQLLRACTPSPQRLL